MWKERLKKFRKAQKDLRYLSERLEDMEARIYQPRAQRFSSTPGGTGNNKTMDHLAIAHIRLQGDYESKLAAVRAERAAIEKAIAALPPEQRLIIYYYYIDLNPWETVQRLVSYSHTHTHRLHAAALRALDEMSA